MEEKMDRSLSERYKRGDTNPESPEQPYIGQRDAIVGNISYVPAIPLPVLPVSDQERAACELMASRYPGPPDLSRIKGACVPGKPNLPLVAPPRVNAKPTLLQDAITV